MSAHRRRSRGIVAGLLVLAGFGVVADSGPAPVPVPPGPPANAPRVVVSLGDSTLSGEGAGDYTPDTNGNQGDWCHRSPHAEIHQTTLPGINATINLACSGAAAADVELGNSVHYTERSQAGQLANLASVDRVVAIVIAVGANDDPHFADTLVQCVQAWFGRNQTGCSGTLGSQWQQRVDAMVPKVVAALRDVREVMGKAGYSPDSYQLVLQSYAAPIGPDVAADLQNTAGCPFVSADLHWVREHAVEQLDHGLHTAADQAGVRFLDLASAGIGHEACSGDQDSSTEWFTRLTVAWSDLTNQDRAGHALQESFHPNAHGQAAFAHCLSAFLTTKDQTAACLAGQDGVLRPAPLVGAR